MMMMMMMMMMMIPHSFVAVVSVVVVVVFVVYAPHQRNHNAVPAIRIDDQCVQIPERGARYVFPKRFDTI